MSMNETPSNQSKVLDFTAFKKKQDVNNEFARSRKPLYVNSEEGRISGNPDGAKSASQPEDFGDRMQKIRSSLDRINSLMADLKKLSANRDKEQMN